MNTESLNMLKGIVDSDKLHSAKVATQENLALNNKNASLIASNKALRNTLYVAAIAALIYGGYHLYQKYYGDDTQ